MFDSAGSDAHVHATLLNVILSGQRCAAVASGCLDAERPPKLQQPWWRFSQSTTKSQRHICDATGAGKLFITGKVFLLSVARAMITLWLAKVLVGQVCTRILGRSVGSQSVMTQRGQRALYPSLLPLRRLLRPTPTSAARNFGFRSPDPGFLSTWLAPNQCPRVDDKACACNS